MNIRSKHGLGLHVVITGNPIDGLRIIGVFNNAPQAVDWASEDLVTPDPWWVAPMESPEEWEPEEH